MYFHLSLIYLKAINIYWKPTVYKTLEIKVQKWHNPCSLRIQNLLVNTDKLETEVIIRAESYIWLHLWKC